MIQASKLSAFKGKVCDQISLDAPSVTGLFLLKRKMRKFCVTRKQARAGERKQRKKKTTEFASASVKREIFGASWKSSSLLPCRESGLLFQPSS